MMHFYHYKLEEVMAMKKTDFDYLFEAMEVVEAQKNLKLLELITYPYLSKDQMKKTHKGLYEKAIPKEERKEKVVSTKDILKLGFNAVAGAPR